MLGKRPFAAGHAMSAQSAQQPLALDAANDCIEPEANDKAKEKICIAALQMGSYCKKTGPPFLGLAMEAFPGALLVA